MSSDSPQPEAAHAFRTLLRSTDGVVRDHRVYGRRIMPGVTFLDLFQRAARALGQGDGTVELRNVVFPQAIAVPEGAEREIEVRIGAARPHRELIARSREPAGAADWDTNAQAQLWPAAATAAAVDAGALRASATDTVDFAALYEQLRRNGIEHREFMQVRGRVHRGPAGALAELELSPAAARYSDHFALHPAFLDAATGVSFFAGYADARYRGGAFIPMFLDRFQGFGALGQRCLVWVPAQETAEKAGADLGRDASISILSPQGALLARFDNLTFKRIRSPDTIGARQATQAVAGEASGTRPSAPPLQGEVSAAMIAAELVAMIAALRGLSPDAIDQAAGFYDLGLQSTDLLKLAAALERRIGRTLYPTLLFEYPSVRDLAGHLQRAHAEAFASQAAPTAPADPPLPSTDAGPANLFGFEWKESNSDGPASSVRDRDGSWLVFASSPEFFRDFEAAGAGLVAGTESLVGVLCGDHFEQVSTRLFSLRPGEPDDYGRLLGALGGRVLGAFHFWQQATPLQLSSAGPLLERGLLSAAGLSRALLKAGGRERQQLLFFHPVLGQPAAESVAAFFETLALEAPHISGRVVGSADSSAGKAAAQLAFRELATGGPATSVRYQGGMRFERAPYEIPAGAPGRAPAIRAGGVYLISGGGGGLGQSLLGHLLARGAAGVVLVGRSDLGAEAERKLTTAAAQGRWTYLRADVADAQQAAMVVEEAARRFGPLNGVFHGAGIVRDGLVRNFSPATAQQVLRPKVDGTLALDEASREQPLDFFALFSSVSAVVGHPGQALYGAANRFMDAFAVWRQQQVECGRRRGHSVSFGWPFWADGGMRVEAAAVRQWTERTGIGPLTARYGWEALEAGLQAGAGCYVVAPGDRARVLATLGDRAGGPIASASAGLDRPSPDERIAIVGLSGRYPKARDLEEFGSNLRRGVDCISEIPAARWDHDRLFDPDRGHAGKCYSRWGGFVDDVDRFDPLFFHISPREAESMDPQERLFLETAWSALEDAGYGRTGLGPTGDRAVGVFVGVMWGGYQLLGAEEFGRGQTVAANSPYWSVANRVSHFFDLTGPSMAVDSACSSSLTAIHLACESLRRGECRLAIGGGVNLSLHPTKYLLLARLGMLSSHGRCKSFGADADGYVPAEGIGAVVLKRFADAVADGDTIHAVIRGSAVNHDGHANGFTVPNPLAQARVIEQALRRAGVAPRAVSYVEAHGTGTALGDPVEIAGLTRAFAANPPATGACAVGSVKSAIGHLEAAAGIAAVTKVVLQLRAGLLFPSLHADEPNPAIDLSGSPFRLQRELAPWSRPRTQSAGAWRDEPRIAGVSSFGAGGANVHVVIEEPPAPAARPAGSAAVPVLVLSARDRDRLEAIARRLLHHAKSESEDINDLLFTLQTGREHLEERLTCVVRSHVELRDRLTGYLERSDAQLVWTGRKPTGIAAGRASSQFPTPRLPMLDDAHLADLAKHWAAGGVVDWMALSSGKLRRVPLPTYPFAGQSYWVRVAPREDVRSDARAAAPAGTAVLRPNWPELPPPAGRPAGNVLILGAAPALREELSGRVPLLGAIDYGDEFRATGPASQTIRADNLDDLRAALWRLEAAGRSATTVVLIADGIAPVPAGAESSGDGAADGLLLRLYQVVRTWDGARRRVPLRLLVASARPEARAALAAGAAFLRSLRLEWRQLSPGTLGTDDATPSAFAAAILIEAAGGTQEVRLAGGRRLERHWMPCGLEATTTGCLNAPAAAGPVLITGGAGGLGLILAKHLAARGWKQIVLIGRSVLPLPLNGITPTAAAAPKLAAFRTLEGSGCVVEYLSADVANEAELQGALARARKRFGPIAGVVHCAGSAADGAVDAKSWESIRAVLAPKIRGTVLLDRLTKDDPLEFFILFSSVAAATGNLGQSDYAAGNAFMDEFAVDRETLRARRLRSGRSLSVAWPLWRAGGMQPNPEVERALRLRGYSVLETEAGLELLDRLADGPEPQALVWSGDLRAFHAAVQGDGLAASAPEATGAADLGGLISLLAGVLADVAKLEPAQVDPDREFEEYGVDSIAAREILARTNRAVGDLLDPFAMAEHKTVRALANHLSGLGATVPAAPAAANSAPTPASSSPPALGVPPPADIAVIGMAGTLPGAADLEQFWANLLTGEPNFAELPTGRWDPVLHYSSDPEAPGKSYSRRGGFVDTLDQFDPEFFGYSEQAAASMDPLHRKFLEVAVRAFEDAGCRREAIRQRPVGVFVGARQGTYAEVVGMDALLAAGGRDAWQDNSACMIPSRVAEFFDLRGPACVIDTACSSSLVSVHAACESLRRGECELALAGGVEALVGPSVFIHFSRSRSLSPTGQCRPFESAADGMILGEGAGAVVLKPLAAALRDGDHVCAVIRASSSNNFGAQDTPGGRVESMKQLMRRCYHEAGTGPAEVGYLELHGEGSTLRDAVELRAVKELWEERAPMPTPTIYLGAVKAQIGHLLLASGIASFIKCCLMLERATIPPHLPGAVLARYAGMGSTPYRFAAQPAPWPAPPAGSPRMVGINASGIAGTNCFVLCAEAPRRTPRRPLDPAPMKRRRFWLGAPALAPVRPPPDLTAAAPHRNGSAHPHSTRTGADPAVPTSTEARLVAICRDILKRSEIDARANFFELGMDSFKILQLFHQVTREFGQEINPTRLPEFPSLSALASHLAETVAAPPGDHGGRNGDGADHHAPTIPRAPSAPAAQACAASRSPSVPGAPAAIEMDFGLYFFSNYDHSAEHDKYRLLLDAVKYADANGFSSVFSPERHFEDFGGLYPNPAVTNAALAMVTRQIDIRAGSVVSPLHDPIRIAEDWAVVDNLSNGRAGLAFTYGWQCDDFVLFPDRYLQRHACMFEQIEAVRKLWRGGSIRRVNGLGREIEVRTYPRPVQKEIPVWLTCAISRDSFTNAGRIGANVVTFLLGQGLGELKEKIAAYRTALAESGFDPAHGRVSLMVHTYLGTDLQQVQAQVREPFLRFIRAQAQLARNLVRSVDPASDIDDPKTMDALMNIGFSRFFGDSGLMGTPASARSSVARFKELGVDELSCLIDFGLDHDSVMASLELLKQVKDGFAPSSKPRRMFPDAQARGGHKAVRLPQPPAGEATPAPEPAGAGLAGATDRLAAFRSYLPGGANLPGAFAPSNGDRLRHTRQGGNGNGKASENGHGAGSSHGNGSGHDHPGRSANRTEADSAPPAESEHDPFPLTAVQKAYWMGRNPQFELGATSTHGYVELLVALDLARFQVALQRVIDRHPMLRATVRSGREQQIVAGPCHYEPEVKDLTAEHEVEQERQLLASREQESHRVFDPGVWPLFAFKFFLLGPGRQCLTFGFDSLIADAASITAVFREIMDLYHNPAAPYPPLNFTFREYMQGYERFRSSADYARDRAFWLERIPSLPAAPDLPLTKAPGAVKVPRFARKARTVPRALWERAKAEARQHMVTPTVLLFTAFAQVLARCSRNSEFLLNLTVFNRLPLHADVNRIVGDFTALMLVPAQYHSDQTFWVNAATLQGRVLESLGHRHFDGVEVIKELARQRDLLGRAAIPVVFTSNLLNTENGQDGLSAIGEVAYMITQTTQAYLDNQVAENREGLYVAWDYVPELFAPAMIDGLFEHYLEVIEALGVEAAAAPPEGQALDPWVLAYNGTDDPTIPRSTLAELFVTQARRTPDAPAVAFGGRILTYGELDAQSDQVAWYLRGQGLGAGSLVGLQSPRCIPTIVNVLGIIKSGAAYVPIDPEYPEARQTYIIERSGAVLVLDPARYDEIQRTEPRGPVPLRSSPDDLAYVIFTSGSTGQPKGVMITHAAAANTIIDLNRRFAVGPADRVLGISSMCFDLSVYDVFGTLACGACLVLIEDVRNPAHLFRTVRDERITLWNSVPTLYRMLVEAAEGEDPAPALRLAMMSGDWIPITLPAESLRRLPQTKLYSLGGATEASIWSIIYPITAVDPAWTSIPYGFPLANQKFYVLDEELAPCPVGTPGQLYIGGAGVAVGYFRDQAKTDAAFIVHPLLGRLYRTGDWGAWRPAGHIEFLGRRDHQVKIRGFRVELGEIESRLLQHPSVKQVVVLDKKDGKGNRSLCAYVVPKTPTPAIPTRP